MRHAGCQFTQGAQACHLRHAHQFGVAALRVARALQCQQHRRGRGAGGGPCQQPTPGPLRRARGALQSQFKRLAGRGQHLGEGEPRRQARRLPGFGRAWVQHQHVGACHQHCTHRPGIGQRPFLGRHQAPGVHPQCPVGRVASQHQGVVPAGGVHRGQHGVALAGSQRARLGFGNGQRCVGPGVLRVAALHRQHRGPQRRQPQGRVRGIGGRLQQRQGGQHRVQLRGALAQQPVRDARIHGKGLAPGGDVPAHDGGGTRQRDQHGHRHPGHAAAVRAAHEGDHSAVPGRHRPATRAASG